MDRFAAWISQGQCDLQAQPASSNQAQPPCDVRHRFPLQLQCKPTQVNIISACRLIMLVVRRTQDLRRVAVVRPPLFPIAAIERLH